MSDSSTLPASPVVVALCRNDPEMKEAYRRAADTLPDFISQIEVGDGRCSSAKLCIKNPDFSEELGEYQILYWWLDFTTYDQDERMFTAQFTELPDCLKPYHQVAQQLRFESEDIFDWRVNSNGRLFGGFTMRVARQRLREDARADYDEYIGVSDYSDQTTP